MAHDCHATGAVGELLYICSRCGHCYICEHEAVWTDYGWVWLCPDGKSRPVILDGRLFEAT
jgi:hypothetical protein